MQALIEVKLAAAALRMGAAKQTLKILQNSCVF
jgi:hypothetical protein